MTKKYIAPGLIDLRLVVRAGKAWAAIEFESGRSTGLTARWASLTTDDPVTQRLIEDSREWKNKRIILKT